MDKTKTNYTNKIIEVSMEVDYFRIYKENYMVEVWGHVGDYEVCVCLTMEKAQEKGLVDAQGKALP